MTEIIGVRFQEVGKIYSFDPDGIKLKKGDRVIVETARGVECGEVAIPNREVEDQTVVQPLKKMLRMATQADLDQMARNREKEQSAFEICRRKIAAHGLEMKLVRVEYTFDGAKILF